MYWKRLFEVVLRDDFLRLLDSFRHLHDSSRTRSSHEIHDSLVVGLFTSIIITIIIIINNRSNNNFKICASERQQLLPCASYSFTQSSWTQWKFPIVFLPNSKSRSATRFWEITRDLVVVIRASPNLVSFAVWKGQIIEDFGGLRWLTSKNVISRRVKVNAHYRGGFVIIVMMVILINLMTVLVTLNVSRWVSTFTLSHESSKLARWEDESFLAGLTNQKS